MRCDAMRCDNREAGFGVCWAAAKVSRVSRAAGTDGSLCWSVGGVGGLSSLGCRKAAFHH